MPLRWTQSPLELQMFPWKRCRAGRRVLGVPDAHLGKLRELGGFHHLSAERSHGSSPFRFLRPGSQDSGLENRLIQCFSGYSVQWFSIMLYIYIQCEAPKIAKLVYNSNNYFLWYLLLGLINQLITGGPHIVYIYMYFFFAIRIGQKLAVSSIFWDEPLLVGIQIGTGILEMAWDSRIAHTPTPVWAQEHCCRHLHYPLPATEWPASRAHADTMLASRSRGPAVVASINVA